MLCRWSGHFPLVTNLPEEFFCCLLWRRAWGTFPGTQLPCSKLALGSFHIISLSHLNPKQGTLTNSFNQSQLYNWWISSIVRLCCRGITPWTFGCCSQFPRCNPLIPRPNTPSMGYYADNKPITNSFDQSIPAVRSIRDQRLLYRVRLCYEGITMSHLGLWSRLVSKM